MDKKDFFNGFDDDIVDDEDVIDDEEDENGEEDEVDTDKGSDDTDKGEAEDSDTDSDDAEEEDVNSDGKKAEESETAKEAEKKAKEAEKNAKFAEMRRKEEAEAKAKKEKEAEIKRIKEEAKLEAELGAYKVNPYTEEPIKDENDLRIFKIQKQIEEEGGDPINDLGKKIAQIERERLESEKIAAEERRKEQEKLDAQAKAEVKELKDAYPELDVPSLSRDPLWVEAFNKDGGRLTLKEIYEYKYLPKKEQVLKAKESSKEDNANSKKLTKTLSSQSNGGKTSPKNYLEMSDEEYLAAERKENNEDFF